MSDPAFNNDRAERFATPTGMLRGQAVIDWADAWRHYRQTGDDSLLELLWGPDAPEDGNDAEG